MPSLNSQTKNILNAAGVKGSLFDQVKNILSGIKGGSSKDLLGDLGKKIDNLKANDALDPNQRSSYIEIIKNTLYKNKSSTSDEDVIGDLSSDMSGATVSQRRVRMYDEILAISRKMPILARATRVFVDNILSPDEITKLSIKVIANVDANSTLDDSKYNGVIDEYKNIIKKTKLEDSISELIFNVLLEGERFVEITTMDRDFKMAMNDSGIKLNEGELIDTIKYGKKDSDVIRLYESKYQNSEEECGDGIAHIMEESYKLVPVDNRKQISPRSIRLVYHNPRNIIIIRQKKWVMGYLYIDKLDNYKDTTYQDEKLANDTIVSKMVDAVRKYLKDKTDAEIPDDLKDSIANILKNTNKNDLVVRFIPMENMQHFKNPSIEFDPYGESYYYNILPILRMYISRMVASTIYSIARAGKHMLIDVDVTNTNDARGRIEQVKRSMKTREVTGADLESIDKIFSHISTFEDIYVPSKDGKRFVNIDTFDMGGRADRAEEDNTLLKNILTGIEIPPALLGIEEYTPSRNTLTQESVIFARSIVRLQSLFTKQLTQLLQKIYTMIHLSTNTIDLDYEDVIATFPPPQGIMLVNAEESLQHAKNIIEMYTELGMPKDIAKKTFIPDVDWDKFAAEQFNQNEEGSDEFGGMGGMGGMGGDFDMGGLGSGGMGDMGSMGDIGGDMSGMGDMGGGDMSSFEM